VLLKILLLDDPMGNLSSLEEQFTRRKMEVVRAWDVIEAEKKLTADSFDSIVASSICLAGDAVELCVKFKRKSRHPMTSILYVPYSLDAEEEKYLLAAGIDYILKSVKEDEISCMLNVWTNGGSPMISAPNPEIDEIRMAGISRSLHDAALRDLASRTKKLDEILENSSDVIYELDPYGRIILISKVIETLTGYSRDELMGMSALDVVSSESIEVVADHISMLLSGRGDPPAVEVGVQAKDGRVIPAEMIVRPIRHKNEVSGILGIGRNVEERKRLEEGLKRALNEKDFYLDLMAHDIQNFNQAIIGYLEMIMGIEAIDPKLERYAQGAFRQVMQTAQLIAHIKRIADIRQHGKDSIAKRDLRDVLQRDITALQSRLDKKLVALSLDCPEGEYPILASDDLGELFDLLVSCAMRYSISDIIHIRVSVSSENHNGRRYWTVTLSGNNLRLSAPVVKCMMSQDYMGCQSIERPDLQLLVARAIVETQDGTIETRYHENGRGDGFVIRIPQAQ
jgi:PAS domain S-box-containing protein